MIDKSLRNPVLFMTACLLALFLMSFGNAYGNEADVTYTLPTQRTDGSALPVDQIQHIRIEYGPCTTPGQFGTVEGSVDVPPPATGTTITGLGYGLYCFRAYTHDTAGRVSDPTNAVSKDFGPIPPPNPPGNFAVAGAVAYEVKYMGPDWDVRTDLGRDVGIVMRTVECGEYEWAAGGYYQVPADAVEFSRIPKSSVVVAKCETAGT